MKTLLYILAGIFLLNLLGKTQPGGQVVTTASGAKLLPISSQPVGNIFLDESGDLVTINATGGTTVLPDPNGIGGGFAT